MGLLLFFPSIAVDNHVTDWGKQPLKFKVDVASMGKLGFDIVAGKLDEKDKIFCKQAITNYNSFKDIVWHGAIYRLVNPHENDIAALMYVNNFMISFGKPASENEGTVMIGQLAWSSNFKLDFEIDSHKNLRLIAGINPFASEYSLNPNETFKTPSLIYALSNNGTGEASRNLHDWARKYRLLDGQGERLTLLNNWEATYFDFDENKIKTCSKTQKI